jgi:hypothetical protein
LQALIAESFFVEFTDKVVSTAHESDQKIGPEAVKARTFDDLLPIFDDFVNFEDFEGIRARREWKKMIHRVRVACKGTVVSTHNYIEKKREAAEEEAKK